MKKVQGFTLIELVIVIVILGILSAIALPRFIRITDDAYAANVNGIAAAIRSAVALARAEYIVNGDTAATTVDMNDAANPVTVATGTGIPAGTALGIGRTFQSLDGYDVVYTDPDAVTFRNTNRDVATCQATYNGTTGAVQVTVGTC